MRLEVTNVWRNQVRLLSSEWVFNRETSGGGLLMIKTLPKDLKFRIDVASSYNLAVNGDQYIADVIDLDNSLVTPARPATPDKPERVNFPYTAEEALNTILDIVKTHKGSLPGITGELANAHTYLCSHIRQLNSLNNALSEVIAAQKRTIDELIAKVKDHEA